MLAELKQAGIDVLNLRSIGVAGFSVLSAILPMSLPVIYGKIIDQLYTGRGIESVYWGLIGAAIVTSSSVILSVFSSRIVVETGYDAAYRLAVNMYSRLIRMSYLSYSTIKQGVIGHRITNDVRLIEPLLVEVPLYALRGWTSLIVAGFALAFVYPMFLVSLAAIPVAFWLVRIAEKKIDGKIAESFDVSEAMSSHVENTMHSDSIALARQSQQTALETERFAAISRRSYKIASELEFWKTNIRNAYAFSFEIFTIVTLLVGALAVYSGSATIGGVVSGLFYVGLLRQPLSDIIGLRYPILRAKIGLDRATAVTNSKRTGLANIESRGPFTVGDSARDAEFALELEQVSYKYPLTSEISINGLSHVEATAAASGFAASVSLTRLSEVEASADTTSSASTLAGVTFRVGRGEVVGVAGPSGSGKSTLLSLICGMLRPQTGTIRVNGRDTFNLPEEDIWRGISLVSQDVYLRNGTLRENLAYGLPDISQDDMLEACDFAGLRDVITDLPDGLNTRVGSRGKRFSGGERQRISVARAYLRKAPLILFDEATSNLDGINEEQLLSRIDSLRSQQSILVVAHRTAALARADRVILLERGVIRAEGKHNELLLSSELYADLHRGYSPKRRPST